ncbi:MAG: hypothetical protein ACREJE_03480, partial [Candidatus Rokuibacteriota bacterium]
VIARARDADALKAVMRTGVGYDVSSPAVAQVRRRGGEEIARVLSKERPLNVVNPEVYAPGHPRRGR